MTVSYSNAKAGANEYISAIITDGPITEDGANIKYYGRVRNCVRVTDCAGTVEINTAGKLDNGDKLYVFNEQYNGDKKTDYASALKDVTPHPMVGRVSIRDAKVVLNKTDFTFNTKVQRPAIETIGGLALKEETDYTAEWSNASSKDVGTYTVTITGKGKYSGTTTATYKISKAYNPLKIKGKTATVKYSKLKKKNQTLAVSKVMSFTNDVKDKKTYSLTSAKKGKKSFKKYFKVNKTSGKLTVKKGLKKGTYKVKIKVNAAGNKNYKAVTKAVTVTVRVR